MKARTALTIVVVSAVAISGLTPVAASAATRPRIELAAEATPADVFVPPADADDHAIPATNAPDTSWEPVTTPRAKVVTKSVVTPNSVAAGTPVGAPGLGALPYFAFDQISLSLDTVARVNLGNGNLLLTSSDGVLNGVGPALRNDRFYNGLSSANGSYGGGWSSSLSAFDVGIQMNGSAPTVRGSNGFSASFTVSGTTYTAPAGFNATLVADTSSTTARWKLTYNSSGETLLFSSTGYITADVDRNGVGSHFSYNSSGQINTVTSDSGRQYTVSWASATSNYITSIQDSAGRQTTYTRNGTGQLQRVDKPGGNYEIYSYDTAGRVTKALFTGTGSGDMEVDFTYDSASRVASISQSLAATTPVPLQSTTYNYAAGTTTVTDGNGHASTYIIDSSGRVTKVTDALGHARSTTWTANSAVATTTDALGSGSTPGNLTTYSYDSLNNATGISYPTGAAASATYATAGTCTGTGGGPNLPKCTTDDAGNSKSFNYDSAGNLLNAHDSTSGGTGATIQRYTYNPSTPSCGGLKGQVCSSTDGNSHTTNYAYDAVGNLTTVTPPAPMGATTYTADSLGRILSVTNGKGETTSYTYDSRDNIIQTSSAGAASVSSTFYPNGLSHTDQDGSRTKTYTYDAAGRLTQQAGPGTGVSQQFTYDYVGNILSYSDSTGTTSYGYDAANELVRLIEPSGTCTAGTAAPAASSGCIKFVYDNNGNETKRLFPGGASVTTTLDSSARPTQVEGDSNSNVIYNVGYSYSATGSTSAAADRAGIQKRYSFNEQGVLASATTAYTYDSLGRLTAANEQWYKTCPGDPTVVTNATSANPIGGGGGPTPCTSGYQTEANWAYVYDSAGNRTSQVLSGSMLGSAGNAGTTTYAYNADNELSSTNKDTTTWTYDAAGNQTRNGITGQTQAVDSRGTVTTLNASSYTTFGAGNDEELSRSTGSTSYTTSALGLATETNSSLLTAYDRTPNGEVVGIRSGTSRSYFVKDALGSVTAILDATGAGVGGYSYSPFGESRYTSTAAAVVANPIRYISGYLDSASGLYKLGARFYDQTLGRFTQVDPSGQEANPYAYAGDEPISGKDPSGLRKINWRDTLGAMLGIAVALVVGALITAAFAGFCGATFGAGCVVGVAVVSAVVGSYLGAKASDGVTGKKTDILQAIIDGIAGIGAHP